MVFQQPNPFPKSIYDNVAYAPLKHGMVKKGKECDELVETSLIKAGLWNEVKDKLTTPGTSLSGGQQQRLCIARTIAIKPEIILMDEPTSSMDQQSELEFIRNLSSYLQPQSTLIIVTHKPQILSLVNRIIVIDGGRIVMDGARDAVLEKLSGTAK